MKIKEFNESEILFTNGKKIYFEHEQDCCENVYCDFNALKDMDIMNVEFDDIKIEPVKDSGFRLNGYFIPCYNEQNGYYSDDLTLVVDNGYEKKMIDLQLIGCVKNDIY
jgi:hypothetical protein